VLAPGVVRIAPGVAAPDHSSCVLARSTPRTIRAGRRASRHVWPYALDPRAGSSAHGAAWLPPAARSDGERRRAARALGRALDRARATTSCAPPCSGLDPALEADLREPGAPAGGAARPADRDHRHRWLRQVVAGRALGDTLRARGARGAGLKL